MMIAYRREREATVKDFTYKSNKEQTSCNIIQGGKKSHCKFCPTQAYLTLTKKSNQVSLKIKTRIWFSVPIIYLSCYQKMTCLCCLVLKLNTLFKKNKNYGKNFQWAHTYTYTSFRFSASKETFSQFIEVAFQHKQNKPKIQKPVIKNYLLHLQQDDIKEFYNILQSSQLPSGMCHIIMSMSYSFLHLQCPTYSWSHMCGLSTEVCVNMK